MHVCNRLYAYCMQGVNTEYAAEYCIVFGAKLRPTEIWSVNILKPQIVDSE